MKTTLLAAAVLACAIALRGQDPPAPTFRTGVDIVHVDVSVLDKERRPVRGLTVADFTVLEDGKPRPIVAFTAVDLPSPPAPEAEAAWAREVAPDVATNAIPAEGRLVAIVFDWSVRFEDQPTARRVARAIVEGMGPGDLGAVAFSSDAYRSGTAQNFTPDTARLLEAIDRPILPSPEDAAGNPVPALDCGVCGLCGWEKAERVADAVAEIPGRRKTMVFLSRSGPKPVGENARCELDTPKARDAFARKAALANLTVHVVDLGLEAYNMMTMVGRSLEGRAADGIGNFSARLDPLWSVLADLTDGRQVADDNEPEKHVPAILEETTAYYVLAFESSDRTVLGRTHEIDVRVARRDVAVQHRSRYQAGQTPAAREAAARQAPLIEAIDRTMPRTGLPLTLALTPLASPDPTKGTVAVALRVGPSPGLPAPAVTPGGVQVAVAALDPARGQVVSSLTQKADIPGPVVEDGGYELLSRLDLAPGRYEIRAALDTAAGARGSVYGFVEVPNYRELPLSLSGVAWHVSPEQLSAPRTALADLLPIVPTARRTFAAADSVTAFVRVYTRADVPGPVRVTIRILDAQGRAVHEEDRDGDLEHEVDLPLERLSAGAYLLSFDATAGAHTATRRVPFTVTSEGGR